MNKSTTTNSESTSAANAGMKNGFQIPKWAGKPPNGLHLDVMKDGKMIQKLMIDENKCYFFGRNKDQCEFVIDHASCSRVHSVLLWHKHLNRSFLIDLNSTHGTFIGSLRLDPNKPQQVFVDSELKFGASTRTYIIRERPQLNKHFPSMLQSNLSNSNLNSSLNDSKDLDDSINMSNIAALPESEAELDNLTEFNTAHNKRIAQLVDISAANKNIPTAGMLGPVLVKKKKKMISFNEEEDVINPEDVDPSVGRFRNMIQTTLVIPNKKKRINPLQFQQQPIPTDIKKAKLTENDQFKEEEKHESEILSEDEDNQNDSQTIYDNDEFETNYGISGSIASNLGIKILDLAPDVDNYTSSTAASEQLLHKHQQNQIQSLKKQNQPNIAPTVDLSGKKIYAKESWPGHKKQATTELPSSMPTTTTTIKPSPVQSATNVKKIATTSSPPAPPQSTAPAGPAPKRLII